MGRRQEFQGGTIYWKLNEAYYVTGAIRTKWNQLGPLPAERSFLGYPMSDEIRLPDGAGYMNRFEHGVIYWSPSTGAHPVAGGILDVWAHRGYESGVHGYPTSDEYAYNGGARQDFQHGPIDWNPNWSIDVYGSDPGATSERSAPQSRESGDEIDCLITTDPDDYTYGPGSALTLYGEVHCDAVPEIFTATLTMWEWDGEDYNKRAEEFYEADFTVDPTPPDPTKPWFDRFSVTASCKPAPYEYHVEYEGAGFHGKFDFHTINSLARFYC